MTEEERKKFAREKVLRESHPEFMLELKVGDFMAFMKSSGNISEAQIQEAVSKVLPLMVGRTLREVAAMCLALMAAYMDALHKNAVAVVNEREAQG